MTFNYYTHFSQNWQIVADHGHQ